MLLSTTGATVSDIGPRQAGDINLSYQTYVNGVQMSPVHIDASAAATDTIDYVATSHRKLNFRRTLVL